MVKKTSIKGFLIKISAIFLLANFVMLAEDTVKERKQKVIGCVRLTKARVFLDSHFFDEIEKNHDGSGKLDYKTKLMTAGLLNCVRTISLEKARSVNKTNKLIS